MDSRWEPFIQHLRELPFVKNVVVREIRPFSKNRLNAGEADAFLNIKTPKGNREFYVDEKKSHLTYALADGLAARADKAGNCRLQIGTDYLAVIEGQTPVHDPASGRGIAMPGYRVLFAIPAKPEILESPVRTIADMAAVSKTTAAETLARLEREGFVGPGLSSRRILNPRGLLDRWLVGYETFRPKSIFGKFRTPDRDPEALEDRIESELRDSTVWAWEGGAAAMRLTKHYRGEETVLHVSNPENDLPKRLRALPADDGPLIILRTQGKIAFEGSVPGTVHPLFVFAELMATGNARAREAATEIRERHLKL